MPGSSPQSAVPARTLLGFRRLWHSRQAGRKTAISVDEASRGQLVLSSSRKPETFNVFDSGRGDGSIVYQSQTTGRFVVPVEANPTPDLVSAAESPQEAVALHERSRRDERNGRQVREIHAADAIHKHLQITVIQSGQVWFWPVLFGDFPSGFFEPELRSFEDLMQGEMGDVHPRRLDLRWVERPLSFAGGDLRGRDFSGSLIDANGAFGGANLSNARLARASLQGTDFRSALLDDADFEGADLRGADFREARLHRTSFRRCNLRGARFSDPPDIVRDPQQRTSFRGATVSAHSLTDWSYLDLAEVDFVDVQRAGRRRQLNGLRAVQADLTGLEMSEADFRGARFQEAILHHAILADADFTDADLSGALLEAGPDGQLVAANLSEATLRRTILENARANGVAFSGAYLIQTNLNGASLHHALFDGAFLAGVDFRGVIDLRGANFGSACLLDADFQGADLTNGRLGPTNFRSAVLQGADFRQSRMFGANLSRAAVAKQEGRIPVRRRDVPRPIHMSHGITRLPAESTSDSTTCPNGGRGPCSQGQLESRNAPDRWPPDWEPDEAERATLAHDPD